MNIKKIAIITVPIVLAATVAGSYWYSNDTPVDSPQEIADINTVDYSPPTSSEQQAGDKQKEAIENQTSSGGESDAETNSQNKTEVSVGINQPYTEGSNIEIGAFVQGVIEGTGTCTAVFTKGSNTVRKSGPAFVDATTTKCEPILLDKSKLPSKGEWQVTVNYESAGYTGQSEKVSFEL